MMGVKVVGKPFAERESDIDGAILHGNVRIREKTP